MAISNTIQQLSVFLENREGRLDTVFKILAENDVNIVALSLADTSDYGMLRMIVSDPHKGKAALKDARDNSYADRCCGSSRTSCDRFTERSDASDRGR